MVKLSDYVAQFIADQQVRHVFMLPGGFAMHLNDSLGQHPDIEVVSNLHEQGCAICAEAYARVTNNLGVACVTAGPGGTNAITGVAAAWLDSTPSLYLSGQVKRADIMGDLGVRQLGVQEVDIVAIATPITKYAVTVTEPESIRYHLEQAVYLARSGRPGPVWLDIPLDVQASSIAPDSLRGFTPPFTDTSAEAARLHQQVSEAIELLGKAERPVVIAGNGIRLAGAAGDFLKLIERLNVPVLPTWLGLDLVADSHPLFAGRPGSIAPRGANFALQNCDWLLAIGSRLDMALTGYAHDRFARAARKIIVDIDSAEIRKLQMKVDVPVSADAGDFIREMLRQAEGTTLGSNTAWVARCQEWKAKYPVVLPEHRANTDHVSTFALTEVLSDELAADDLIVPGSSGNAVEAFFLAFKVKAGQRVFHERGLGAMGFALPASIGACIASGRRRTVSIDGDGGFQMNIQELEVCARLNLPIKCFVINNGGYASIRASQRNYFGRLTGADASSGLTLPDVTGIAAAYKVKTMRIIDQSDLTGQVRRVLDTPGPVVCEVLGIPDEARVPRLSSAQRADGSMVSKPLEDLFPFLDRDEFLSNMIIPPLDE